MPYSGSLTPVLTGKSNIVKRYFIGIDISMDWLDLAVWDKESANIIDQLRIENRSAQILKSLKRLVRNYSRDEIWICFEHTGNYGLELTCSIEDLQLDYSAVPAMEIKKSQGIKRGKSDKVDAKRIAEFAAVHSHRLKFTRLPAKTFLQVKQLLTYRNQLVKTRTAFKNSLKSHKMVEKVTDIRDVTIDIEDHIKMLGKNIKSVEARINELLNKNEDIKKNLNLVKSVRGIGPVIAATIIVCTQNFTTFDDPRKFNCYTGLAPFEHSSGLNMGHTRTSKLRDKKLKALMMNAANSAVTYDPQIRNYYVRKTSEGKNNYAVLNAVACKLIYRVFATVKRQTPYVILQN